MTGFYDVGPLGQLGLNLFHGYGYNFYRSENQLRADDQKVRTLVSELLARAQKAVSAAEGEYRREFIPPPTRENPFPPANVIANAKKLEALCKAISGAEGQVRHAPVPENDRITQLYREEGKTLAGLIEKDTVLVGQADTLRALVAGKAPDEILGLLSEVAEGLAAIAQTLAERRLMTI